MTAQLDLIAPPKPEVDPAEVLALESVLMGRGWMTAANVMIYAESGRRKWTDRCLRAIAHASHGAIISGQKGYKLTREATLEEVQHSAAWLRNQAKSMLNRAVEIDRVYHKKERPAAAPREDLFQ